MSQSTEIATTVDATPEQVKAWSRQGASMRNRQNTLAWEVGDWYNTGKSYSRAAEAVQIMDGYYSRNSLYQLGVVASAFPTADDRKVKVSMAIYQNVAA